MKTFTKFGLAAVSATLLALGAATPAFAANINVGPSDVAGYENGVAGDPGFNYTQWHVGNYTTPTDVSESLVFNECSVTLLEAPSAGSLTQVLLGFENRPSSTTDVSELQALLDSISIDVAQGSVTVQIPVFRHTGSSTSFTTFRNSELLEAGVHNLSGSMLVDSQWGLGPQTPSALTGWMQGLLSTGNTFEILGVGFNGSVDAVVNSISFGGNTYYFGTGNCAPAAPTAPTIVQTAAK